ncbi:ABC transporter permease [Actinokineospora sp. NPDC004072]
MKATSNRRTAKALGFEIAQHARNRLALALVVFFIPAWVTLVGKLLPEQEIAYRSSALDATLMVPSNRLATISGVINAVTLIVGFMMFSAVRRFGDFDRRLVQAGYSRVSLLLAKLAVLLLVSTLVAAYATAVMTALWTPEQVWLLALGLLVSALTYGGMGIVLGIVLPTELAGMFVIIMISLVDVIVQNPVINPAADGGFLKFMPTYGATQSSVAAGFTDQPAATHALIGLAWLTTFSAISILAFYLRTRNHTTHDPHPDIPTRTPSIVTLTTGPDGTLEIRSTAGPILLCTHGSTPIPTPTPPRDPHPPPTHRPNGQSPEPSPNSSHP